MTKTKNEGNRVTLYTPHGGQWALHGSPARFRVCCTGRRWGKTLAGINELAHYTLNNPGRTAWWVAPVYRQAKIAFRFLLKGLKPAIRSYSKSDLRVELLNDSVVEFLSADNYDALRGTGVNLLLVDEAPFVDRDAWEYALRPTLTDTGGRAIFIGTPKGRNWFYELFVRGMDPEYPEYASFTFPTSDNPFIDPEEIEEARNTLPEDAFRQEYLAKFLEDSAGVFRRIRELILGEEREPTRTGKYVIGYDPAKVRDFGVMVVLNRKTGHLEKMERMRGVDYTLQVKQLAELSRKYNKAPVLLDSTGVGDPLFEGAKKTVPGKVDGYHFTGESKKNLIEHLVVSMEQKQITYPNLPVLIGELELYQYEMTRAGNLRYSAPKGFHDDCVTALALANWARKNLVDRSNVVASGVPRQSAGMFGGYDG